MSGQLKLLRSKSSRKPVSHSPAFFIFRPNFDANQFELFAIANLAGSKFR
ncbi:MAG: hypothetical protein ACI8P0_000245 [Planctomycetaceae bacterium]|jgi:hypothetical protein